MTSEADKKLQYLKRDEVRTMEKDIARLREQESELARGKIAQIKTGEEARREADLSVEALAKAEEREKMEAEAKEKLAESEASRQARQNAELLAGKARDEAEEREKEKLRMQFREAQSKEEEARRRFLEGVARRAGEARPEGAAEKAGEPTPIPPAPTPVPPPVPPLLSAEVPLSGTKAEAPLKKPFKFSLPSLKIPKPQIPAIHLPKVQMPKITGYFPARPSIFEKIWIRVVVSLFILAVLTTIVTFWYWYLVIREKPLETKEPEKTGEVAEKEAIAPLPLIPVESTVTLEIASSAELPNLLSQTLLRNDLGYGKFTRILIKNTAENKFLGLREFFETLQVRTLENFYNNAGNDFTLFVYSAPGKNQLGLAAKAENPAVLRSILESWEQTLEKDTDNLFLLLGKKGASDSSFQKSSYKDAVVHYLSFPEKNFGICWAITNNYFILTSSGESIIKTIDKIKE